MQFTFLTAAFLLTPHIASVLAAPTLAEPVYKRDGILDDSPGDLTGKDLAAWKACVKITAGEQGRSCASLPPGSQDGCYSAEITIQKPCENAGVQKRLTQIYCSTQPKGSKFC